MRVAALATVLITASPAYAGPPFVTDDPVPTDVGKWEVYAFDDILRAPGVGSARFEGEAGFDINYGIPGDIQLTTTVPLLEHDGSTTSAVLGDIEIGAKWRILRQGEDGCEIDLAVFPKVQLPTAAAGRARIGVLLPVWASRSFSKWSLFGGGGYAVVARGDGRSHGFAGLALNRQVSESFSLGAELYHEGAETPGGKPLTLAGLGASLALSPKFALIGAFDPVLADRAVNGRYRAYLALAFHN